MLNYFESKKFVQNEVRKMSILLNFLSKFRFFQLFSNYCISKYPYRDIVLVNWIAFGLGVYFYGRIHFWVVSFNSILAILLQRGLEFKRPVEYVPSWQPSTDTSPESYGFPSLETYLSVVIFIHLYLLTSSLYLIILSFIFILLIGLSRIISKARFPYQILLSIFSGFLGLFLNIFIVNKIGIVRWKWLDHGKAVCFVIALFLVYLGLAMENNESRLGSVPKKVFLDTMVGVYDSSK